MAKLQSNNLTLEIIFKHFEDEWVAYDIKFYCEDDIIVKDEILKRTGWWNKRRSYGAFSAEDYQKDYLIETIKTVLETNNSDYWEPMEPDVKIAIYPNQFFPFLKSHWGLDEETEEIRQKPENHEKSPDDLFTIITFIDAYNFKDSEAYTGEGISLHLIVERIVLEKFVKDLELEYSEFNKNNIINRK